MSNIQLSCIPTPSNLAIKSLMPNLISLLVLTEIFLIKKKYIQKLDYRWVNPIISSKINKQIKRNQFMDFN